jgi:hypothetical protein
LENLVGSLPPGGTADLILGVSSKYLNYGQYLGEVLISGEDSVACIPEETIEITLNVNGPTPVKIEDAEVMPNAFKLNQNYPNPFNKNTIIDYSLMNPAHVTLKVFNLRGEVVAILVDQPQTVGSHQVTWHGDNSRGEEVASGIYFYQLTAGDRHQTRKLVLLK